MWDRSVLPHADACLCVWVRRESAICFLNKNFVFEWSRRNTGIPLMWASNLTAWKILFSPKNTHTERLHRSPQQSQSVGRTGMYNRTGWNQTTTSFAQVHILCESWVIGGWCLKRWHSLSFYHLFAGTSGTSASAGRKGVEWLKACNICLRETQGNHSASMCILSHRWEEEKEILMPQVMHTDRRNLPSSFSLSLSFCLPRKHAHKSSAWIPSVKGVIACVVHSGFEYLRCMRRCVCLVPGLWWLWSGAFLSFAFSSNTWSAVHQQPLTWVVRGVAVYDVQTQVRAVFEEERGFSPLILVVCTCIWM